MITPLKVFLCGSENNGWALDADMATTRESLSALGDRIQFTTLERADIVHSVWERPLLRLPAQKLAGKRILCHICNDLLRIYEQACMIHADRIGLWISQSRQTERLQIALKRRQVYVPYSVDAHIFTSTCPPGMSVQSLRDRFGIPADRFVIGNFMRDTLGSNLRVPKDQKGVELFLEIAHLLHRKGLPIHILLAGPRRHWIRARLRERGIPLTYVGTEIEGDDNSINILDATTINLLYHASDLHLVSSRWEGGPRSVLEAAAARIPILSTPMGLAPDVLEPECLFRAVDEGAAIIERHVKERSLDRTVDVQFKRVMENYVPAANVSRFGAIYDQIEKVPVFTPKSFWEPAVERSPSPYCWLRWFRSRKPGAGLRIGLWHEFHKPPYGGGNQFLMALKPALQKFGVSVEVNRFSRSIQAHLCNSAWFAVDEFFEAAKSSKVRMIHRVDGPIALYRGTDWNEDKKIYDLNTRLASATVYQSGWCFTQLQELGFRPVSPTIIRNAVDGRLFHSHGRVPFSGSRKIRLISTAWSDNPQKGGPFFKWLEGQLDWDRYEYTFVGRTKEQFERIRHVAPLSSKPLGRILRQHDIYIMASQREACSNALIEALSCGLPVLYLDDGANGEIVQFGGLPFKANAEAPRQLDRLAENLEVFRSCIHVQNIDEIALKYIELFQSVLET